MQNRVASGYRKTSALAHRCLKAGREHEGAPRRPGDVQARHRRVLVGYRVHGPRVERPQSADRLQRVHEAVGGGKQPRRHEREEGEADQGEGGREGQHIAPQGVALTLPEEQIQQGGDGDHEVPGAVVGVPEAQEPVPADEPGLDDLLVVEVPPPLEADHPGGVGVGLELRDRLRPPDVADGRVDGVERGDVEDLPPPARPAARRCAQPGSSSASACDCGSGSGSVMAVVTPPRRGPGSSCAHRTRRPGRRAGSRAG